MREVRKSPVEGSEGLEGEAALAGALGERLHAPVVAVAAAVEDAGLDPGLLGACRDELAGAPCLVHLAEATQLGLRPVDGGERVAAVVVDELRLDAAVRAEHRQPRALRGAAHLRADPA